MGHEKLPLLVLSSDRSNCGVVFSFRSRFARWRCISRVFRLSCRSMYSLLIYVLARRESFYTVIYNAHFSFIIKSFFYI